jgi:GT2 family glycosyltransferase
VLGVSIVLYRSPLEGLVATLRGVAAQTTPPARVAIHANAIDEAALEPVRVAATAALGDLPWELSSTETNLGFTGAHNEILARLFAAGCDATVVLNPDLVLANTALAELAAAQRALTRPALLGPVLELGDPDTLEPTGRIDTTGIRWTRGGRHLDDRQGEQLGGLPSGPIAVAGISGACLYVTKAAYDRVMAASGEFFDAEFIAYREDAELAYRAELLGVTSYLVPAARGVHARRLRGTSRGADPAIDSLGVRNRFLIAFKYGVRRPGGFLGSTGRDLIVVGAVLARERSSLPGLREAWRLRHVMRAKGRQVREFRASQQ